MGGDSEDRALAMNRSDYVAAAAKSIVGAAPFAGSLLAEIAGAIIPNQRVDRIASFAVELERRIANVEQVVGTAPLSDEEFTDLVEESLRQAARSISDERRAQIASLVANSLTSEEVTFVEAKHFMRVLGDLNEIEIVRLGRYQFDESGTGGDYYAGHTAVLDDAAPLTGYSQEAIDCQTIQDSYDEHLEQLGLTDGEALTHFGRLFCRQIGILEESS